MNRIGAYQAKTHLPAFLNRVERGESFLITRNGIPAAQLIPASGGVDDRRVLIKRLQEFGRRHRGRLRGIRVRPLNNDGRHR